MNTKILPLYLDNTFESIYGNFGSTLGALLLEGIFLIPLTVAVHTRFLEKLTIL